MTTTTNSNNSNELTIVIPAKNEERLIGSLLTSLLVEPEVDSFHGILWTAQLMHLQRPRAFALEIRTGHVHLRSRRLPRVDFFFQFEIGVSLKRSRRTNRRHPAR